MDNGKRAINIGLFILSCIALLLVVLTMIMLERHERRMQTPCEELIKQNTKSNYVPLPKRCMEGEK